MTGQYVVRVYDTASEGETDFEPVGSERVAIEHAEKEAKRLAEYLDSKRDDDDRAIYEEDGRGRYLVWNPVSGPERDCAYVVTVEEDVQDADLPEDRPLE